ncbi:extracellular solute-binding protein [Waltera sp.]|uniref:extracellular solute-binding protein n=1 Tax=Waltera sp. TaxID=2815806 RepID=UPI0039A3A97D
MTAALDASSYNGELYSVPFFVHTPVVFYRTDLFEAAGITEFPKTWEEYEEAAEADQRRCIWNDH